MMKEERRQVLVMLSEGKISPEQASELLDALGDGAPPRPQPGYAPRPPRPPQPRRGIDRDLKELMEARIHGVTPEYIRGMTQAGFDDLSMKDLIELRSHGVTPEYVQELAALGYTDLSAKEIADLAIHGISVDFVRGMQEAGYTDIGAGALVELQEQGIDPALMEVVAETQGAAFAAQAASFEAQSAAFEAASELQGHAAPRDEER